MTADANEGPDHPLREDDPGKQGARVLSVSPGGPAAEAGLRDKDIIIALDGEDLPDTDADRVLVAAYWAQYGEEIKRLGELLAQLSKR